MNTAARPSMTPALPSRDRAKARLDAASSPREPAPAERIAGQTVSGTAEQSAPETMVQAASGLVAQPIFATMAQPMSAPTAQPMSASTGQPVSPAVDRAVSAISAAQPTPEPRRAPLLLRVLSGPQQGAQVPVRHHRLLIGNLESECDVVLDLGDEQPHVCLVRASRDGWTAMAVSGDLWLEEAWATPQQVQEIFSGTVLTLGQVSFCIADSATMDWEALRLPESLQRPQPAKGVPPAVAGDAGWLAHWPALQSLRPLIAPLAAMFAPRKARARGKLLLAALLASGLGLACVGATLILTAADSVPSLLPRQDDAIAQARAALASVPGAGELTLTSMPERPRGVAVGGWLREQRDGAAVEAALQRLGIEYETRWSRVDELQHELGTRFAALRSPTTGAWRYSGQGSFVLPVPQGSIAAVDAPARQALLDLGGLRALGFEAAAVDRAASQAGSEPLLVQYLRDGRHVKVSGLERWPVAQRNPRYVVQELRLTGLRSVVLDNGARYFEGAALPDGAVLTRILPDRLQLQQGASSHEAAIEIRTHSVPLVPPIP